MKGYNPYGQSTKATPVVRIAEVASFEQEDHPALSRNLLRELQTERAKHYDGLLSAKDWADFEKRRGLIHGIDNAISLCEHQQKLLSGQ